jgi:hypothetical protein
MSEAFILLYRSIHDVMRSEAVLRKAAIPRQLVPVPTSITSDCGMALSLEPSDLDHALACLASARALPLSVYHLDPSGGIRISDRRPPPSASGTG